MGRPIQKKKQKERAQLPTECRRGSSGEHPRGIPLQQGTPRFISQECPGASIRLAVTLALSTVIWNLSVAPGNWDRAHPFPQVAGHRISPRYDTVFVFESDFPIP